MLGTQIDCPACKGHMTVGHRSTVNVVCPHCHSVWASEDGELRRLGEVVALTPTRCPLRLGLDGSYQSTFFRVTGHVQLRHDASGAIWDEFYLGMDDGQCAWLAFSQGRYLISFPSLVPEGVSLPSFETAALHEEYELMPGLPALSVVEKGQATVVGASGELPYTLKPGEHYRYLDLAAMNGAFASLDCTEEPPELFVGREITLDELGLATVAVEIISEPAITGSTIPCTECSGEMTLRARGQSERVTCPHCRAFYDVRGDRLHLLGKIQTEETQPFVPLGSVGQFPFGALTLLGFLEKATTVEGIDYFWKEYLLVDAEGGFHWLAESDGHWTLFDPVTGGGNIYKTARYKDKVYKLFQQGPAVVTYLAGEFYWNVEVGQVTYTADYVVPPEMLSVELSHGGDGHAEEANWTLGTYQPVAAIEKAFGVSGLPRPRGIGPNQPFNTGGVYGLWLLFSLILLGIGIFLFATISTERIHTERVELKPQEVGKNQVELTAPFELKAHRNLRLTAGSDVDNGWLHVVGHLINEDTSEVQVFEIPIEYYHGIEAGEAWSEGDRKGGTHVSALPPGKYMLRLEIYRDEKIQLPGQQAGAPLFVGAPVAQPNASYVEVQVEQGSPRVWHLFAAFVLISIVPGFILLRQTFFESRRWQNSTETGSS